MTHKLLYRIPDNIYQTFFSAKVALTRLPPQYCEAASFSECNSSSDESGSFEKSFEYYLENSYNRNQDTCVNEIMITRSAHKKLNQGLPGVCPKMKQLEPIPKIIIKKKSKKKVGKKKNAVDKQTSVVASNEQNPASKTLPVNYAKKPKKRRPPPRLTLRSFSRKAAKKRKLTKQIEEIQDVGHTSPRETVTEHQPQSAELSIRTAETGYSSAADSTTNEPVVQLSKPILNYTLIPKPKKGRHSKTCCLDFIILPPTDPTTPTNVVPIVKLSRGRPRKLSNVSEAKNKSTPKVDGVAKKPRKIYMTKTRLAAMQLKTQSPPFIESLAPVPGKSLPILEGPPNIPRAAWIKNQLMSEDFMCRIPLSKISRIPRVIKIQMPAIFSKPKSEKLTEVNIPEPESMPLPPPPDEPKIESPNILEMAAFDSTKVVTASTTIETINDWFPQDLDLSSLNETNYTETDMVLEDQYFPKNKSFTSTPCPDQPGEQIETYMTEKLATEALPDISFGSTFLNYTDSALVTPVKRQPVPPPQPPVEVECLIAEAKSGGDGGDDNDENHFIPVTVLDYESKSEALDFSFKRPFKKQLFQIAEAHQNPYIGSPASEPLDLSVRTGLTQQTTTETCTQNQYEPSLSPQEAIDDVLLLDTSYQDMDCTPRCNSNERIECNTSPLDFDQEPQQPPIKNAKIDILSDMDAMELMRQHNLFLSGPPIMYHTQGDFQKSKIFSELNKITRSIQLNNECDGLSQPDQSSIHVESVQSGPFIKSEPMPPPYSAANFDDATVKRRVRKIFGYPCFRFLSGQCIAFPCRFSHKLMEAHQLQKILTSEPVCVIEKCYDLVIQHEMLFIHYFEIFCILFGKSQMVRSLIKMIGHCERIDRPIGFFRHIITGLGLCKLDKVACYAILVGNIGMKSIRSIDVLIEIMIELDVVLQFTEKLEELLKFETYRLNVDLFDRLLGVGKRTKNPELIRILLETINSYPSDCQKRLNSTVLTQFLQMVRNLSSQHD